MNNKKYYPFERNHYFYGKLLTVRDFDDEQQYMNDKRRILNFLTNGAGVVSGLHVVLVDDKTISIEAGMALDYQGREMILEESLTKKLNVIEGFSELENETEVYLCLKYDEEKREIIHKVGREDAQTGDDYNRIAEGCKIYLTNEADERNLYWLERLTTARKTIFNRSGVKIIQSMPSFVKKHQRFEIQVVVEKTDINQSVEVEYSIQSEFIKNQAEMAETKIYINSDHRSPSRKLMFSFPVFSQADGPVETELYLPQTDSKIVVGNETFSFEENIKIPFSIIEGEPRKAVIQKYLQNHFDDVIKKNMEEAIYLAKFQLVHRGNEYTIIDIEPLPFSQFVLSNQMLYLLEEMQESRENYATVEKVIIPEEQEGHGEKKKKSIVCGTEDIPVDLRSKGKVYFSDEIVHGFDAEDVHLSVAVNETARDNNIFDTDQIYFGNMSILQGSIFEGDLPPIETAVIAYPKKGTFRIAVKPLEDIGTNILRVKWWARDCGKSKKKSFEEVNRVSLHIFPDTISIAPREKFKFNVELDGTDYVECRWSVTDKNGGEIDMNGVYEAPAHEGVYEIVVESIKYPNKKATAFIVVREE